MAQVTSNTLVYDKMPQIRIATWDAIISYIRDKYAIDAKLVSSNNGFKALIRRDISFGDILYSEQEDCPVVLVRDETGRDLNNVDELVCIFEDDDTEPQGIGEDGLRAGILSIFGHFLTNSEVDKLLTSYDSLLINKCATREDIAKVTGYSFSSLSRFSEYLKPLQITLLSAGNRKRGRGKSLYDRRVYNYLLRECKSKEQVLTLLRNFN